MSRLVDPSLWASAQPFGAGEQRPNNYFEIWDAINENRHQRKYAWRAREPPGV